MSWEIRVGDALDRLREMPDGTAQCCVTSPPYWGLRDYDIDGQLGLEETPEEFVASMVEVFAEVRRALRDDGTLWLNLGDSYVAGGNGARDPERWPKQNRNARGFRSMHSKKNAGSGLKPKDLAGVPWTLALALRADGWYLRRDVIWAKPNPMPESVSDRPSSSHEFLFLLTKKPHYFYDAVAIREPAIYAGPNGAQHSPYGQGFSRRTPEEEKARQEKRRSIRPGIDTKGGNQGNGLMTWGTTKNKRSVWEIPEEAWAQFLMWLTEQPQEKLDVWNIATRPFVEAHFATFPPDLVKPCILARLAAEVLRRVRGAVAKTHEGREGEVA